ncbi:MAG: ATPase, T2SS/T4P/T4SS family [archaeon]
MEIGGLKVGDYAVKEEAGARHIIFACRDCPYGASVADDLHCRFHVITALSEVEADLIVLSEVYERVYGEKQTKMLAEIASLMQRFNVESVWSYKHLGTPGKESEQYFSERHDVLVKIAHDELAYDPILSYLSLLREIKIEDSKLKSQGADYLKSSKPYLETLAYIKNAFEATELILKTKDTLSKLRQIPETSELYRSLFEADIKPSFIGSRLMFNEMEKLELLDEYTVKKATVQIFAHPNKAENLYFVNPPEYTLSPEEYFVMSKTREVVSGYKPGKTSLSTVAKSRRYFERLYESTIKDVAKENNVPIEPGEIAELASIVARYTVGYGILEILLNDRNLTDIYLDSPIGQKPLYVVHSEFGQCQTNILYTQGEANALASKLRAMSGRPFDEAHPVLDCDLPDLDTRIAIIGPPLSPDGMAFAFRLHKVTPWTLPQFIDAGFLNPLAAGLISFFVDMQATMLITGSRGSGKTSLLSSCMLEIPQNTRIIVQEDSVTGDSSIVVERNGNMERTTVGELIDGLVEKYGCEKIDGREILFANPDAIRVFSMDKKAKMQLANVTQFIRHKVSKDLYEIETRTGKKIKVTEDHCLFGLVGNEISPVKSKDLREGSFIATPRLLPCKEDGLQSISLLDSLDKIEAGCLVSCEFKGLIQENWGELKKIAKGMHYSRSMPSAWKRLSLLPVKVFKELNKSKPISLDANKLLFKVDRKSKAIPAKISLDETFLNFVGLWLADGCYDGKYGVIISEPKCIGLIESVAGKMGGLKVRLHSDDFSQIISNTNLNFFMKKILGLNGNAYTKDFPDWVFRLSKKQTAAVLKGLYSGDGYNGKYEVRISLASKRMIDGLQFLLLPFGIVARKGKMKKDKTIDLRISSLKMVRSFAGQISFLQEYKIKQLQKICERTCSHDVSDIIPLSVAEKKSISAELQGFNAYDYVTRDYSIGRGKMCQYLSASQQSMDYSLSKKIETLVFSDVYWDEIKSIKRLGQPDEFVYDFSVPENENFLCENIIAHNTLELPIPYMKKIGFNVQRLKTRSPISVSKTDTEVSPQEALRTALRLGDSALVIGEIRSNEAKVLYEAMRIGAAGNIVMGTVHGDSAYSVWDRVVNDLDVPNTSFKATDIVVVARPIRFAGSMKRNRRVVQLTEVKKHWNEDPEKEGALLDLMLYDARKDSLELMEDNLKESELFEKISRTSGLTMKQMWADIRLRAEASAFLVEAKNKHGIPKLLEAENTTVCRNKLIILKEIQLKDGGTVDYDDLLGKWKYWINNSFLQRFAKDK